MSPGRVAVLVAVVVGVLGSVPTLDAQDSRARRTMRIGRLSPLSAETDAPNLGAFRRGLRDLGWVEGRDCVIETRFAHGDAEQLPTLAMELVRSGVDLILAGSTPGALAAKGATNTIPIVIVTTGDPVSDGLVASLAKPGGNLTGVTALGQALNAKRLELLKESLPGITRVAVIVNPASPYTAPFLREREGITRTLGIQLRVREVRNATAFAQTFEAMARERADALMVLTDVMFINHRRRLVEFAATNRLPAVYGERAFVEAGGLMFYGASLAGMYRRAAAYADKILRGVKPAELPIEQPTKFEMVLNLHTARTLGLTIPQSVAARADRLIE